MSIWNLFKGGKKKPLEDETKPGARVYRAVGKRHADRLMQSSEAIYAAVSRISNALAMMPIHLYRNEEIQFDHPLEKLVAYRPHPNFSTFTFFQTMECFRNIEGTAYALIVQNKLGGIERLDILDPNRVQPQREIETGEMWYWITLDDGKRFPVPACMILVLRHMSANGELGIKPTDVLAGTVDYDKRVKEFSLHQLDGVNQGVMLTVPNTGLGKDARDRVIDSFLDAYERSGNRVVILEGGLQAQSFSQTPVSAQVLDTERIMRNRVATVFNIPPHLLGDYSDTTFGTAEQQMLEFLNLTIMPIAAQYEQELNGKLLLPQDYAAGYRFRFDAHSLLRADIGTMANKYQIAIRGSWMTPNEVRKREGLPPVDNGDKLMASRDLIPLDISTDKPELLLGGTVSKEEK